MEAKSADAWKEVCLLRWGWVRVQFAGTGLGTGAPARFWRAGREEASRGRRGKRRVERSMLAIEDGG